MIKQNTQVSPVVFTCVFVVIVEEVFSKAMLTTSFQSGIQTTWLKKTHKISAASDLEGVGNLS